MSSDVLPELEIHFHANGDIVVWEQQDAQGNYTLTGYMVKNVSGSDIIERTDASHDEFEDSFIVAEGVRIM